MVHISFLEYRASASYILASSALKIVFGLALGLTLSGLGLGLVPSWPR